MDAGKERGQVLFPTCDSAMLSDSITARITHQASSITYHASRFTLHLSRIKHQASSIKHHVSRFAYHASRVSHRSQSAAAGSCEIFDQRENITRIRSRRSFEFGVLVIRASSCVR